VVKTLTTVNVRLEKRTVVRTYLLGHHYSGRLTDNYITNFDTQARPSSHIQKLVCHIDNRPTQDYRSSVNVYICMPCH